ncbi:MAG: NapC/NirT family cytochrome c [Anaerolineae bacterium]|nr:NapC/NirT family cytochrome c [Anaerolineae bacterium]
MIKKLKKFLKAQKITLDFSNKKHRRNFILFNFGVLVFGVAFLYGNVRLYEYTESSEFCGTACHPMAPQFVRYEHSAHANVECVQCHIGPGAESFIKSKINGLRQVYELVIDTYSRPIKSPVHDLRPARDTCENCHSPTTFKDNIIKNVVHYDNDKDNTPVQSTLILKMGGWEKAAGISLGIHWHVTNKIYYITADEQRQVMLWIGVEQEDGSLKEFYARDTITMAQTAFVEQARAEGKIRLMDCIDCHNRAAHFIPSPQESVDKAISAGVISKNIPFIRSKAIDVLTPIYTNQTEAFEVIEGLKDYYSIASTSSLTYSSEELQTAVDKIKEIYTETNFPEMNLNWESNPNNQGHTPTLGCFRCHDGKHVNVDDTGHEVEVVSVKCNQCHTVPIVGRGEKLLVEAPVIVGQVPDSHADFRWTIEHRDISDQELTDCYQCHGQAFCNNDACHNLSHPPDMLYTHADIFKEYGDQVCYTCHQNIQCSQCHPGGIISNP